MPQAQVKNFKWYAIGHDFGNSEECDVLMLAKGGKKRRSTPTAFTRVDVSAVNSLSNIGANIQIAQPVEMKKGKGKGKVAKVETLSEDEKDEPAQIVLFKDESIAWAFGHFALEQGKKIWNGQGDNLRYASKHSVRGMLASIAGWIPDKEFGLLVVTGLPGDLFMRYPELRKQIKEALDGVYEFSTDGGVNWRICHVEIATVVMEGAGALIAYGSKGGKMTRSGEAGVIDIGGGTVDLYAQRGPVPIAEYCRSDRQGVEAAASLLRTIFLRKHPRRGLTDVEVRKTMFAFASGRIEDFPPIAEFGETIPASELQDMVEEAVESVASEIAGFVISSWREADGGARFNPVLLVGGGYYYFFDAVKNRIPHVHVIDDNDELFAIFANAEGYAYLAARKLAEKLKKDAEQQVQVQQEADQATETSKEGEHHASEQDAEITSSVAEG